MEVKPTHFTMRAARLGLVVSVMKYSVDSDFVLAGSTAMSHHQYRGLSFCSAGASAGTVVFPDHHQLPAKDDGVSRRLQILSSWR